MSKVFRQVALERLSSPEQLDQLIQVTDPKGWLALAALGTMLLSAVAWGVLGSIPSEATGEGILIRQGGVSSLVATGSGQVEEILVGTGDLIEKGQPVATIRQDALSRQIDDVRARQKALEAEYLDLQRYAAEQRRLRARDLEQQRANLKKTVETLEKDVALLAERIEAERGLLADGLITKQTFLATEQAYNAKRDELAGRRLEINGLELKELEAEQQVGQQLETRRAAIRDLELEARELAATLAENVKVVSQHSGRVLEVLAERGDVVNPGDPVLSLEVISEELLAVLFVPATSGKKVEPGMEAQVAPSTVKREEFGALRGKVTWVAEFPVTQRGMVRLLGNEALVVKLLEQGPLIQVNVALTRDPTTPTGYRWSSSRGPNLRITSGTLATGSVVVKRDRPISLLLPAVKEKLGV
jgi:HlyD family secretion protein